MADQDEMKQYELVEEILTDIERYKAILDVVNQYDEGEFADKESETFSNYLSLFDSFGRTEPEPIEMTQDIDLDTLLGEDTIIIPAEE